MELTGWATYFATFLLFFLIGFYLISTYLFQDHEIKSKFPILLFSSIFSFSLLLLEMVFFEIFGIGSLETRYYKWLVTLCALTYASLFILPTLLMVKFLQKLKIGPTLKIALMAFCGTSYIWLISKALLDEFKEHSPDRRADFLTSWKSIFNMFKFFEILLPITQVHVLASIGMIFIAVLSGFGAINLPVSFFNIYDEKMLLISQSMFDSKMIQILESISAKKIKTLQLKQKLRENGTVKQPKKGFFSWFSGNSESKYENIDKQIEDNQLEVKMLKQAHNELFLDYCDFAEDMRIYKQSQSMIGRVRRLFGKIMSVYCLYKILITMVNIFFGRGRGLDPITNIIKISIRVFNVEISDEIYEMISSYFTFLFLGILIFLNVKSFVKNFLEVFRFLFRRFLAEVFFSEIIVHFLSEIVAIYFISSFLLMYNNFPVQHRKNMEALLGDLDFRSLYRVFDVIFLVSVLSSGVIIWLNIKLKKMKYTRYLEDQEYETYKDK